jgi:trehalose 6-phosphate synthase
VNPWNTEELAGAYQEAVTMSDEQRALNFAKLDKYVSKYTRYAFPLRYNSNPRSY